MKIEKEIPADKQIAISAQDLGERTIRFCISNEEQDRDGDIMKADGCDFTNFAKNPQFLPFHDKREFPVGVPKKWWIDRNTKTVWADVYFPTVEELATDPAQASEKAKLVDFVYNCYKTKMMSAVSVSFIPKALVPNPDDRFGSIISKWELLEFSAVSIPANADALMIAGKSYGLDEEKMKMFFCEDKDPPEFKSFDPDQKSGKRISAETMKTLESVKACHEKMKACSEKMKACLKEYKACHEEMEGVLTGLMTEPGEGGGEDEPDNGEKMLKIADGNETVLDLSD